MVTGESFRFNVIGAGPNGLAAAITLATAGHNVTVFEGNDTIGGGARSAELTLPGFIHDVCSTSYPLAAASRFFRSLPLDQHGLEWIEPDVMLAHPLDDGPAASLRRSIEATTQGFHPEDARRYRRAMGPFVNRYEDLLDDALAPPHLPRHPLLLARFGRLGTRSACCLANSQFQHERARALFAGLAAHSVLPLERSPSAAFGLMLAIAGHAVGWPLPRGGAQRISDALASYLRSLGGMIVTAHPIKSIRDLPPARANVFDVTPRQLIAIAGDELPSSYRDRLARYRYGPGVFKIDWALAAPPSWNDENCRAASVVHVGGGFDEVAASERAPWEGRTTGRPFVLFAQQSVHDPSRAPAGRHTGWAYCHVPSGCDEDMTNAIEAQIERFAPGFRDLILARSTMKASELEQSNPNLIGGDVNGGVADLRQLIARPVLSPRPHATPNPSIYICSSSTPPGGGVHGLCGYHAAMQALRDLRKNRQR